MHFEIIGEITNIEIIAMGNRIRILPLQRKRYGTGRWRKLKGSHQFVCSMVPSVLPNCIGLKHMALAKEKLESSVSWIDKNMTKQTPTPRFAICINTDDPDLLTPRSVYEVFPDESAAKSKYVRVVDNEGEDYLYPADYFVFVKFPQTVQRTLRRVSHPNLQNASVRQRGATTRQRKPTQRAG